jgi:hypothetical protein
MVDGEEELEAEPFPKNQLYEGVESKLDWLENATGNGLHPTLPLVEN